jgi:signal transduction histidine kinase
MRKRRWLWIVLFVFASVTLGTLAALWNVVILSNYFRMVDLARDRLRSAPDFQGLGGLPWWTLILGTVAIVGALVTVVLFFIRLLREMRLNQLQTEFLANVTHELKTPLASLALSSSLIRSGQAQGEEAELLWRTHESELTRLQGEIERLLAAARWEQFHDKPKIERLDLGQWLRGSLPAWRAQVGAKGRIEMTGDPLDLRIDADPKLLDLVVKNLIDNSKKFSMGRPEISIKATRLEREGQALWHLEFSDKGLGFRPEDHKKIFKRFYRAKHHSKVAIPGTGLGLHLVATACKAMKILIAAHSEGPGKGATFSLSGEATS